MTGKPDIRDSLLRPGTARLCVHMAKETQDLVLAACRMVAEERLAKLNAHKTGEQAERRRQAAKKGSPELRAKLRARPQCEDFGQRFSSYWSGREQSDEHVLKRTGHAKKRKS